VTATRTHGSDTVQTQPKQVHPLRSLKHKLGACCSFGKTTPLAQQRLRRVGPRSCSHSRSTAALTTACAQSSSGAPCVGSSLNRFLHSTRSRENLSSGEKRAGCALCVGLPSGASFCARLAALSSRSRRVLQRKRGLPSGASFCAPLRALRSCGRCKGRCSRSEGCRRARPSTCRWVRSGLAAEGVQKECCCCKNQHRQACRHCRTAGLTSACVSTQSKVREESSGDHLQRVHALACGVGVKHQVHAEPPTTTRAGTSAPR